MIWDAVVVGGGPAGSATAFHLARRGHSILLLDRSRFPRDKPCGEFLSPAATPLLEDLGVRRQVDAAGARRLARVRIEVAGAPPLELTIPGRDGPAWGYSLSRRRLDAILIDSARRAGARIEEEIKVEGPIIEDNRVVGVTARDQRGRRRAHRARLVIGAGGRNCPVAHGLGVQRRARRRRYDLLAHWPSPAPAEACVLHSEGDVYTAAAPIEDGLRNVNCVVSRETLRRQPDPESLYRGIVRRCLSGSGWTEGAPAEAVSASDVTPLTTTRAAADGALLVGDSALFLDPFTGQGLYLALRSAAMAAEVGAAALAVGRSDRAALVRYDRLRATEFDAKRRVSAALQLLLRRPWNARRAVRALAGDGDLAATLAAVTADLAPARRVWSSAYAARLGLALFRSESQSVR